MQAMIVQRLPSIAGLTILVGDIHGHVDRLMEALMRIEFDFNMDRLVCTGNLVDRGPDSRRSLALVHERWFHSVRGNHEEMAIAWPRGEVSYDMYAQNGGGWNISGGRESSECTAAMCATMPLAIEIETDRGLVGVVHADCPVRNWSELADALTDERTGYLAQDKLQWSRTRFDKRCIEHIEGVRAVVVGHTPVERPTQLGNVHHIDTGGWHRGRFTLLNAATLNEAGVRSKELAWT